MAQARAVGQGFRKRKFPLDLVLTSPLVRARQTAEEMLRDWPPPIPEVRVCDELAPEGKTRKLARFLRDVAGHAAVLT